MLGLTETWMEEERWKKIKGRVLNKFKWICTPARRESKKERMKGRIVVAINKNLQETSFRELSHQVVEN